MIESGDPGIRLFIRNERLAVMTQYRSEKTVLYVHGATQAASSTFDLKIDRESWMDYIARHGYDVYLVDLRGYGRSTRPPEFAKPVNENPQSLFQFGPADRPRARHRRYQSIPNYRGRF